MEKSEKLKTFLILKTIKSKSNIRLNRLTEIKIGDHMTLLNLIIF